MSSSGKRNGKVQSKASVPMVGWEESVLCNANVARKHLKLAQLTPAIAITSAECSVNDPHFDQIGPASKSVLLLHDTQSVLLEYFAPNPCDITRAFNVAISGNHLRAKR
jgi:hypothetical protein